MTQSARQLFEEILEREPEYIGSYYHLAKLLERIGEAGTWRSDGMKKGWLQRKQQEISMRIMNCRWHMRNWFIRCWSWNTG